MKEKKYVSILLLDNECKKTAYGNNISKLSKSNHVTVNETTSGNDLYGNKHTLTLETLKPNNQNLSGSFTESRLSERENNEKNNSSYKNLIRGKEEITSISNKHIFQKEKCSKKTKNLLQFRALFKRLEDNLISERTWYLQGEVTASKRPINSALEMSTSEIRKRSHYRRKKDIASSTPACVKLESVIKHRILTDLNEEFSANKTTSLDRKLKESINAKPYEPKFQSEFDNDEVTKIRDEISHIYNELYQRLRMFAHI